MRKYVLSVILVLACLPVALAQALEEHRGKEHIFIETPGLAAFEANLWEGVFVPAKTPASTVAAIQEAFASVLAQETVRKQLLEAGTDPVGSSAADFKSFLTDDRARFAKMFSYTGLQPQ